MKTESRSGSTTLLEHPGVVRARRVLQETDELTLRDQVELTEIPAPPFEEEARGRRMAERFEETGLQEVRRDGVGNVLAELPGRRSGTPLILSAHLDTVFPPGTEVRVRRDGPRWIGPGISDDSRGLAALLALGRALRNAPVPLDAPLLFVATVGEEGSGNLRGARHLFAEDGEGRSARGFVSLDGAGTRRIVTRGLGVRRFRVTCRGPGGHSWIDRDTPNPIHALGTAVSELERLPLPSRPPVGLTVARWGGGTSINAVPGEAWVEIDLRSESRTHLRTTEKKIRRICESALCAVNARRGAGREQLTLEISLIGDRPSGRTASGEKLVRAARDATRAIGADPELSASSTDANVPMSMGIPAVTLGAGGKAGLAHTPEEWYENEGGVEGLVRALLTALLVVGIGPEE